VFVDYYVCIMITSQHTLGVVITGYIGLMKIALVLQKYYTTEGMDLILLLPTIESPPFLLLWPIHPGILTILGAAGPTLSIGWWLPPIYLHIGYMLQLVGYLAWGGLVAR